MKAACAYYRTSSATNVGTDKDSLPRQQAAVRACAAARGLIIVHEFYDAAVSGADPVDSRQGFAAMLQCMLGNGARTIVVESASRFARDLIVQETGYQMLKAKGIELIAADSPESFLSDTPTAAMIRQILGAVSQFEKATLVNKLRGARDRKSRELGRRIEGNPNIAQLAPPVPAEHIEAARALHAAGLSLRGIAAELEGRKMLNHADRRYGPGSIARMLR
jgi:DNA invertase Pin-like site-specific DNA recombinase